MEFSKLIYAIIMETLFITTGKAFYLSFTAITVSIKLKGGKGYMQIHFKNIAMILALLSIFLTIFGCATSGGVGGDVLTSKGWHHPNKTKQEQQRDFVDCRDGCEKSVRAKGYSGDFAVFHLRDCEDQCMKSKGYEWY